MDVAGELSTYWGTKGEKVLESWRCSHTLKVKNVLRKGEAREFFLARLGGPRGWGGGPESEKRGTKKTECRN